MVDHVPRQKVGAPPLLLPEGLEVVQGVDPVRDDGVGARAVVLLVVLAQLRVGAAPGGIRVDGRMGGRDVSWVGGCQRMDPFACSHKPHYAPLANPGGGHGAAGRVHCLAVALCVQTSTSG